VIALPVAVGTEGRSRRFRSRPVLQCAQQLGITRKNPGQLAPL